MAQADLFSRLTKQGGTFELFQKTGIITMHEYNDLLQDAEKREFNIYATKQKIFKTDTKSLNIFKKISEVSGKIYTQQKIAKDIQKSVYKQQEAIAQLQRKASNLTDIHEKRLYDSIIKRQKVELINNKLILDQTRRTVPIFSSFGNKGAIVSDMLVGAAGTFGNILSVIGSITSSIISIGSYIVNLFLTPIKKVFDTFLKMQSIVGNLSADIGLTAKDSNRLFNNFANLTIEASRFGGSMSDVASIFNSFSQETGKNRIFSKEEIGALTELGLGTGLGIKGATDLAAAFDNAGIALSDSIKLTNKARDVAGKYGINTTKILQTYQSLVKSLTGIGFGRGLDNLTKLAAKAEAIRFDVVKSTEAFKDRFFDPSDAVEAAAKMQVLGGKFSAAFGDPIRLAFESMSDPAGMAEKFADTVKGQLVKGKNGEWVIPPSFRKQMKIAADTLGQNYEDLEKTAIEQAKISDKLMAFGKGSSIFTFKEDDRLAIASLIKLNKNHEYVIKNSDGVERLLSEMTSKDQLQAILSDRKKNEDAAIQRKTLTERLALVVDRFMLGFSKIFVKFNNILEDGNFMKTIENFGSTLAEKVIPLIDQIFGDGGNIKKILSSVIDRVGIIAKTISDIWNGDGKIFDKLKDSVVKLIGGVWDLIVPFLKSGIGEILMAIGETTGFDSVKVWGERLMLDASAQNKVISGILDEQKKSEMIQHVNTNKGDLSMKQTAATVGTGIGGAALGSSAGGALASAWLGGEAGAMAGSVVPVIGNIVGAIGGAVLGGLAAYYGQKKYNEFTTPDYNANTNNTPKITNVKDALVTSHGIIKGDKGDMWMALQQTSSNNGNNIGNNKNNNATIEHTGTIIIKSDDGKSVTWDQMYSARDILGRRIASLNNGYNGGFADYQDPNIATIKPLR